MYCTVYCTVLYCIPEMAFFRSPMAKTFLRHPSFFSVAAGSPVYVGEFLAADDAQSFKAAGILPYRYDTRSKLDSRFF